MGCGLMNGVRLAEPGRPLDKERHAAAPLVDASFVALHAGVEAFGPGAVVGQEQDDGVLTQAEFVEPGQQPGEVVVDVLAHSVDAGQFVVQPLGFVLVEVAVGHREGECGVL